MKIKAWLFTLVIMSCVMFGLYTYKTNAIAANAQAAPAFEPAATVEVIETSIQAYQNTAQVTGNIKAPQHLTLKNELAGVITELRFSSGDVVNKGDVLLTLDTRNEVASLGAAQARLTLSEQTVKRYKKLVSRNEISAELVDKAASDLNVAIADIKLLQTKIDKKTITAPFSAVVGLHELTLGQYLDGNSSITQLVGTSDILWVEFSLPQSFPELVLGENINISASAGQATASIIAVDPVLTAQSRHLKYRAQFNKNQLPIKPHALVDVIVPVNKPKGHVLVPDLALTHDQFGDYVFILTPEDSAQGSYRAKRTQVWLASKNNGRVILEKGVEAGQLVATTGAFKLREGMKVFIAQPKSQPE